MSENKIRNEETVHLLMKRYDDGDFTSELLNSNFRKNINLSCAKGEGLALHEKKPGHIFIVAGGTGIYPFIDVIDLLFKRMLVDSNHNLSQKIIEGTPAVKDSTLKTFKFTFIAAFKSMSDLHPITQYQCSKLG